MNNYSIPPLITSLVYLSLSMLALRGRSFSKPGIGHALFYFATFWWQGSWFFLFNTKDPEVISVLVRVGYSGILFLPATFFHSMMNFAQVQVKKWLFVFNYFLGILFLCFLWGTDAIRLLLRTT